MTENAYSRAADAFDALLAAPTAARQTTPAALIKAAGLPASSGYRHVAALEADGFLRRDESGTYLPGPSAIRTGLRAHCLGHLAPAVQPILLQLRQAAQATAFLAISQDMTLTIGPHSIGRGSRQVALQETYSFETVPEFALDQITEVALRTFRDGVARRIAVLLCPVETSSQAIIHLGLLAAGRRDEPGLLSRPLAQACAQFRGAALDRP